MPITVNVSLKGFDKFISVINRTEREVNSGLLRFARLAQTRMHNEIKSRIKRRGSSGKLAGSIRIEVYKDFTGTDIYIGNTQVMSREAPYWYVVNYGKKFTGGTFRPGMGKTRPILFDDGYADSSLRGHGSGRMGRFKKITSSSEPKPSAIRPLHYIERTNSWIVNYWQKYWESILQ